MKHDGLTDRLRTLGRVAWAALALTGCGGTPLKSGGGRDAEAPTSRDAVADTPMTKPDVAPTRVGAEDAAAERAPDKGGAGDARADTLAEGGEDARDAGSAAKSDVDAWIPAVATCTNRDGVPFVPAAPPDASAAASVVSRLDQGDPKGTVVQVGALAPSIVASSDGSLSLPFVPDGTYNLTLTLGPWEETIPQLQVTAGKPLIVDGTPFPLAPIELQRAHRLVAGSSSDVRFDTSTTASALVYSQYAKSAGTVAVVPAAGGAPTTLTSGWVSRAFFVEDGRRIAVVMLSGSTLAHSSIDLVDPATATRTPLVADFRLDLDQEFLFTPERLGYRTGSTAPLDLVIERLDVGDRFTVTDVNNVWQRSPDKRWLAVYTSSGGLRTVDLDTGTVHFVSSRPVNNFEFTADSQRVVFSDQVTIYSADAATGAVTQLAQSNEYLLSPDGRLVLIQPSISQPLQVVPVTGGSPVTVTIEVSAASVPINVFSKDGEFVFMDTLSGFKSASTAKLDVQTLTTAGNGRVVDYVPSSKTAYFIADGAYVTGLGPTSDFYRMPLDHSRPCEILARGLGMFMGPMPSPSGRYIAFAAPDAASSRSILMIIDTTTGAAIPLAYATTGRVTFSPDESWVFLVDDSSTARLARLSDGLTFPLSPGPYLADAAKFSPSGDRVMYEAGGVLVTAPVQPCPLPTFVVRNADLSSARWINDRALVVFRTGVAAPFSFANGLYRATVP
jgi:hypothetical protein